MLHKLLLYLVFGSVAVGNKVEIQSAKCVLQVFIWAEMATETGVTYALSLLRSSKKSSDTSFSRAVVTFEVVPHQECMCPHGMKVVIYSGFTAYY